jgi:hypothetical protein
MASEYRSLPAARSANQLFAAMFTGAYALLFVDRYAAGQLASDWTVLVLGALVVVLGVLGFPAVEWRGSRLLTAAYVASFAHYRLYDLVSFVERECRLAFLLEPGVEVH